MVAACSKGDKTAGSVRVAESSGAATPSPAQGPVAALSDGGALALLDEANVADSTTGAIAAAKGTRADVKAYGRDMMKDHHKLRAEGQELARTANLSPAMPAADGTASRDRAITDSLGAMSASAAWDTFYIDGAVTHHEEMLRMAQNGMNAAQNADLRVMIAKAVAVVQVHLDHAKQLQSKMR
jgi:putative membrane protein